MQIQNEALSSAVQHYIETVRRKGLTVYSFPTARALADVDPMIRQCFEAGTLFVSRAEHSDFEIFRREVGYPLPEDIAELLNAYWQPGIFGYYKDFPECFILFPAMRNRGEQPDDFFLRHGGLVSEVRRWIEYDGDPVKYLPIGIYDPYSCNFILYEAATGRIFIEAFDDLCNRTFEPVAGSLAELISGLFLH